MNRKGNIETLLLRQRKETKISDLGIPNVEKEIYQYTSDGNI